MTTTTRFTAREIARSIHVGPRTKRFVLRDEYGLAHQGGRYAHILGALSRSDKSDLPGRVHTVAYALLKCISTARMNPDSANRIVCYSPYRLCALVARIANECPEDTIGGICDEWLCRNHEAL